MPWYSPLLAPFKSLFGGLQTKSDPTYGITAQFYNPGDPIWSDRNYHSFVTEGYKKCSVVYACTNKIAQAAAGIRWKLYSDQSMQRTIDSHPLLDLWNRPNPQMGPSELVEQLFGFLHLAGNAYLYASQLKPTEAPVELWPLYPDQMKIVAGQYAIQGYVYGYGGPSPRIFELGNVMHLKFPSYDERSLYGLSPVEVAMRKVDSLNTSAEYGVALKQNYGSPSALFTAKGYITVEQRNQIKSELRKKFSGKRNAGMPLVLEADMNYQQMSLSPKEMDWLASDQVDERGICMIMDVPSILLSDYEGATYANRKEAKQSLFTENVLPKMDKMVGHVNMWLVPMYEDLRRSGAYFSYDKKDIEVLAELYTDVEKQFKDNAVNLYNNGGCSLRYLQQSQGMEPKKSVYLDVYKMGPGIYIREEDLEAYAEACLEKAGAAPSPMIVHSPPPALPAPKPSRPGQTTVTEVPPDDNSGDNQKRISPRSATRSRPSQHKVLDLATKEEKAAYLERIEKQRQGWETKIERRMQDYFKNEQKAVVAAIKACSTTDELNDAVDTALDDQQDALLQVIYNAWLDVSTDIGGQVAAELSGQKGLIQDFIRLFGSDQIKYLLALAGNKIKGISATTQAKVRLELTNGVAQGESVPELAKRITGLYDEQITPNRSKAIAHDEVMQSSNYAAVESAKQSGLTLNKVWLATEDSHTRPDHADADGQEVGMDEKFVVGDVEMDRPGDPEAPADQSCGCRCTVYFKRVKPNESTDDQGDKKVFNSTRSREFRSVREFLEVLV